MSVRNLTTDDDFSITEVRSGTYRTQHDMSSDGLCLTIALALADVDGSSATEVVDSLSSYVDPDGLNRLFRARPTGDSRGPGRLVLEIADYTVTIHSDGTIIITE